MTVVAVKFGINWMVSTHMPLTRHDAIAADCSIGHLFLLTCLLRGMTGRKINYAVCSKFLLTCLLRGMTTMAEFKQMLYDVSTHMPLTRHDGKGVTLCLHG